MILDSEILRQCIVGVGPEVVNRPSNLLTELTIAMSRQRKISVWFRGSSIGCRDHVALLFSVAVVEVVVVNNTLQCAGVKNILE